MQPLEVATSDWKSLQKILYYRQAHKVGLFELSQS